MRQEFSKKTKLMAFQAQNGKCANCHRKIVAPDLEYHHDLEATFGGGVGPDNCVALHKWCHLEITKARAPVIAKSNRQRAKHLGLDKPKTGFATNKAGRYKKHWDGTVTERNTAAKAPSPPLDGSGQGGDDGPPSTTLSPPAISLRTERLVIEPLMAVFALHLKALNDDHHMRFSDQRRRIHTESSQRRYLASAGPDLVLLNIRRPDDDTIGTMSCHLDRANKVADLGIMIVPEVCGWGYGKEAWVAVMNYWLTQDYKVEAGCHQSNEAMRNLLYETMLFEGVRWGHYRNDDGTRSDWLLFGRVLPS